MSSSILGKKLLFFIAHPDDETFLAAGTIYKNAQSGGESFIVCATVGEKGKGHLKRPATENQLKAMRKKELHMVAKISGAKKLNVLNFPDTQLNRHKLQLRKQFLFFVEQYEPDFIVSFGSDGVTGHLDHIACGRAASIVSRTKKIPFVAFCAHPSLKRRNQNWMRNRKKFGKYAIVVRHPKANVKIKVDPRVKLRCLKSHKSQQLAKDMPEYILQEVLHYEYFSK